MNNFVAFFAMKYLLKTNYNDPLLPITPSLSVSIC